MTSGDYNRRFPAPWTAERLDGGYRVHDRNGVTVAWVYAAQHVYIGDDRLSYDEARRIAANIAKLPELLKG